MRALSQPANPLYQPLDAILGTPAAIRILRVLARHGGVLSPTVIAKRGRINRSGAGRTLSRLAETGVVEVVGQGRYVSYRLRPEHPFGQGLTALFRLEAERVEKLFDLIRDTAQEMQQSPRAVWLISTGDEGDVEGQVRLALVGSEEHLDAQTEALNQVLTEYGSTWGIDTSLLALSTDELRGWVRDRNPFFRQFEGNALPLYGESVRQLVREL